MNSLNSRSLTSIFQTISKPFSFSNIDLEYHVQRGRTEVTEDKFTKTLELRWQQREEASFVLVCSFTTEPDWAQLPKSAPINLTSHHKIQYNSMLINSLKHFCELLESSVAKYCKQADVDDLFVVLKGAAVQFAGDW